MYAQGKSLGRQLAQWLHPLCDLGYQSSGRIWLMGRDMDVFFGALSKSGKFGYITGLNRANARKLAHRGKLESWLRSIGVKDGDILVDSGYAGSIFQRISETNLKLRFVLLTASPDACGEALVSSLNDERGRHIILALEHSPKREVVSWDDVKRRPVVSKLTGDEGRRAREFFEGCVAGLRSVPMW